MELLTASVTRMTESTRSRSAFLPEGAAAPGIPLHRNFPEEAAAVVQHDPAGNVAGAEGRQFEGHGIMFRSHVDSFEAAAGLLAEEKLRAASPGHPAPEGDRRALSLSVPLQADPEIRV